MNNDNPLIPQGSLFEEKARSQARVKKAFFFALSASVLTLLVALIAQGCKREQPQLPTEPAEPIPTFDTNYVPMLDTNLPPIVMDTNVAPPIAEPPPVTQPPPSSTTEHTIARGDTFSSLATKYGVTVKAIADANPGVDPTRLQIGKRLNIPPASTSAPGATGAGLAPAIDTGGTETYTVKSGDNLTKIANKFGVTVRALRSANNLRTDRIKVGDKLKIPAKAGVPAVERAPVVPPESSFPTGPTPTNP